MKINAKNNFLRVFKLPKEFSTRYCFGYGINTNFVMVDWFEPYPTFFFENENCVDGQEDQDIKSFIPLNKCQNQEIELDFNLREKFNLVLSKFIKKKNYCDEHDLLVITNYGDSFIIKAKED